MGVTRNAFILFYSSALVYQLNRCKFAGPESTGVGLGHADGGKNSSWCFQCIAVLNRAKLEICVFQISVSVRVDISLMWRNFRISLSWTEEVSEPWEEQERAVLECGGGAVLECGGGAFLGLSLPLCNSFCFVPLGTRANQRKERQSPVGVSWAAGLTGDSSGMRGVFDLSSNLRCQ